MLRTADAVGDIGERRELGASLTAYVLTYTRAR